MTFITEPWFRKIIAAGTELDSLSKERISTLNRTLLIESTWSLIQFTRNLKPGGNAHRWMQFMAYCISNNDQAQGQLLQDLWVLWESGEKSNGYFVEFGACGGKNLSNTYLLEKQYGWTGIVAEPNPVFHTELYANRECAISTRCVYSASNESVRFRCTTAAQLSRLASLASTDTRDRSTFTEID